MVTASWPWSPCPGGERARRWIPDYRSKANDQVSICGGKRKGRGARFRPTSTSRTRRKVRRFTAARFDAGADLGLHRQTIWLPFGGLSACFAPLQRPSMIFACTFVTRLPASTANGISCFMEARRTRRPSERLAHVPPNWSAPAWIRDGALLVRSRHRSDPSRRQEPACRSLRFRTVSLRPVRACSASKIRGYRRTTDVVIDQMERVAGL
jgi:hypothetical protein